MKKLVALSLICISLHADETTNQIELSSDEQKAIVEQMEKNKDAPGAVIFNPPQNWKMVDPKALPKHVLVMIIGTGQGEFPPNMNLGYEKYDGSVKDFIRKVVKVELDTTHAEWKALGTVQTNAGVAELIQVDTKTKWGQERQMQAFIKNEDTIYILTASALRTEFPTYYKEFFNSIRSLSINPSDKKINEKN